MNDFSVMKDLLREHGVRLTRQRAIILQALCDLEGHASAEEVHERVTLNRRDVDLSTVYRTLERLRDLRIVSQTDLGHGRGEYEVVLDPPHHHMVCQECGRTIELSHAYLAPVAEAIRRDFDFEPIFDHWAVFGLCPQCQERA